MIDAPRPDAPAVAPGARRLVPAAAAFALFGCGVLALAASVAVYRVYQRADQMLGMPRDVAALVPTQPPPTLDVRMVMVRQMRQASELATAIYTLETVVTESQARTLGGFEIGRTDLLYVAHGEVRAGVDLGELMPGDVTIDGDRVEVRLPAPELLDRKIDVERSYVYDLRQSLLGPLDPAMQSRAEQYALDKIVRTACAEGILDDANARADAAVRGLLGGAGYRSVTVRTRPPAPAACPMPDRTDATPAGVAVP